MTLRTFALTLTLAICAGIIIARAQTTPATVDGLVSAAKVAAGTDWPGTFTRLCIPPPPAAARGGGAARGDAAGRGDAAARGNGAGRGNAAGQPNAADRGNAAGRGNAAP